MKIAIRSHWKTALLVAGLAVLACTISSIGGHHVDPSILASAGMLPMMLGETADVGQITELLKKQGTAFEEYKAANDALIKAKADGAAVGDLEAKVAKINEEFTKLSTDYTELAKKLARPKSGEEKNLSPEQVEHKEHFARFLRKGDDDGLADIQRKAMNTGSDPDGGFLVIPEMDKTIDRIASVVSAMFRVANVVTIGTNKYTKVVKKSGMAMTWPGEGNTSGETVEPTYAEVAIEVFPGEVEPWVFNETLQDAFIDLEADLADEAGISFAEGQGAKFITGTGVGAPRGLAAYPMLLNSSYAWGSVGYIASGKAGAFMSAANAPADRVIDLQHALKSQYRPGANWLMNDATLGKVRQLKDGSGQYYLWQPDVAAGFGGRLLGSPVEIDDNFADVGANSLSIAYGNFKRAYTIVRRNGIALIRDNVTAKGKTKFNFRQRVGGGITNYEAVKFMRFATS